MLKQKISYLLSSTKKRISAQGESCPSCGASFGELVQRKYVVTSLVRCKACRLLYRTPTTSIEENRAFYQKAYTQGVVTNLPSDAELSGLIFTKFNHPSSDYSKYIEILQAIGCKEGDKLFDFGCSWGYGSWQFKQHGFDVQSFEISKPRGEFAKEKLGVDVLDAMDNAEGPYDIFFSAHVLEHVPSVQSVIEDGFRLLRSGGVFMAITPTGSAAFRSKSPTAWSQLWGNVHPQFLDDVYYNKQFQQYPHILASNPFEITELRQWGQFKTGVINLNLLGDTLLCIAIKD
jgi:2-polyprenyl-3-methyl-5-hydroxy-6-metoxy-1,4-benzoquinol methylase